ncbi:AAA family ATPase [Mesorhizobium sp. ESP7-2]|uniref:AAA family ATPase n=1 Tax=Mesorhizobium sp. ESP7-2 TaxID=2876622 RepID=UPI002961EF4F|nr:AAA family ATPase [Mesorhizobium sp. ESP7-2]MBZ9706091.1 AAA family ATPase [Mesorhizobium sp. ESP7-2]
MIMSENHFLRLWALGYTRLAPITPPGCTVSERSSFHKRIAAGDDARGKAPGIKWGDGTWSGFDFVNHESTEADLLRWHDMGAGVGVKTGRGLIFVDCDTSQIEHARIVKEEAERFFGLVYSPRIGRDPKWGFPLRTDPEFRYCRIEFGERDAKGRLRDRVEVLSEGRQFVTHGIHPSTQKPYRWPQGTPAAADLPYFAPEVVRAFLDACSARLPAASAIVQEGAPTDVEQSTLKADLELIRQAVAATPNTSALFPTREAYRDFGYAIKAATIDTPADGLAIYQDWCARWTDGDNDPDVVEADWNRMKPPFRRGANWIFELATQHSNQDFSGAAISSKWFEAVADEAGIFQIEPATPKRKFEFERFSDAADAALNDTRAALIKGILDQGAMTVLYGPSNVGKTFVAMDIAYHIAAGLPYDGRKTVKGCVIYVAAEGGRGARRRVRALRDKYRGEDVQFLLLPSSVDLRRPDADLKPLVSAIQALGVPVLLIVVDTLSRAMAGGDENSSVDMGYIVNHFDALRAHTSAHLLVVHHSGKNAAQGARGHSLLRAATDTEIEIAAGSIEVTKQREMDGSWSTGFTLEVRTLGVDADGDPITSCTVKLVKGAGVSVGVATPKEADVLKAVEVLSALSADAAGGVSVAELVDYFSSRADDMSDNAVRVMIKKLAAKGLMDRLSRGRWKSTSVQIGPAMGPNIFD